MRRLAAAAFAVAALLVLLGAAIYFLREERPAPAPVATPEAPVPRKEKRRGARPPLREPPAPAPGPETAPAPAPPDEGPDDPDEDEIGDDWRRYPEDAKGPVVVGIVSQYGDPDPDCWVALESVEDPSRPDPSVLESLSAGRFRLTGLAAGRYRVRAKMDDTPAAYSKPFDAKDGEVVDAGHLRLLRRGCVSGILRDAAGAETDAEVRLFGRDPATLKPRIVEDVPCAGRQGFQFAPHEAGEFLIAATGKGGWLVHGGKTDAEGIAWVDLPLKPWSTLEAEFAKAPAGAAEAKELRFVLEPLEVPDVGIPPAPRAQAAPARFERLLPGKYRLRAEWREAGGGGPVDRRAEKPIEIREGAAEKATLDR